MSGPSSNVTGVVYFTQESPTGPVVVRGELKNLDPEAERGFHIQCVSSWLVDGGVMIC
jgi:hypothetical protein